MTEVLAIYAACLSTVVFIWNITQSKPKIKVSIIFSIDTVEGVNKSGISIFVQNRSSNKVHISSVSILYRYKKTSTKDLLGHLWKFKQIPRRIGWIHSRLSNYEINDGCPISLEGRSTHRIFVPEERLDEIFKDSTDRYIMAVAQDQLWNNRYSEKFHYPKVTFDSKERRT